jgi:hypothetical protein
VTCIHTHPQFGNKFRSLYANWTYVTGKNYWRSCFVFS